MKKIVKPIAIILSIILLISGGFVGGYFVAINKSNESTIVDNKTDEKDLQMPGETETQIVTVDKINSKLIEISQFSAYSSEYEVEKGKDFVRNMLDDIPIPGTTNNVTLKCKGIVKVGYDFGKITPKIDTVSHKIYLSLPEIEVNDNYIIWESIECTEENNILHPIDFKQYQELALEIEAQGLKQAEEKGIYEKAEVHAKTLIENFFKCFEGYTVEFV